MGRPLLARGAATLDLGKADRVDGRLRSEGADDVVVTATSERTDIFLARPEGPATIEADAAARCLILWGRRPGDPSRWRSTVGPEQLAPLRALLSGY